MSALDDFFSLLSFVLQQDKMILFDNQISKYAHVSINCIISHYKDDKIFLSDKKNWIV